MIHGHMELPEGLCGAQGNVQLNLLGTAILLLQPICYGKREANKKGRNR